MAATNSDHHAGYDGLTDDDIDRMFIREPDEINDLPEGHDIYVILPFGEPPF